jgi:hypothetical protein
MTTTKSIGKVMTKKLETIEMSNSAQEQQRE